MENKTKIAVLTWINYHNYGSYLQASALQHVLSDEYEVRLIDFCAAEGNRSGESAGKAFKRTVGAKVQSLLRHNPLYLSEEQKKKYAAYKKAVLSCTPPCCDAAQLAELNKQFDVFIAGSDQIWAPTAFNDPFFLNFVNDDKKKIAYAPSLGINRIDDPNLLSVYRKYLVRFDALSVREDESVRFFKKAFQLDAEWVLDPVFLLKKEEWDAFLGLREHSEPYLLAYFLGDRKKYWKAVLKTAREQGLPIKIIPVHRNDCKFGECIEAGPREFAELIKNARFVCTDSFHAMAFSLIYNKPFFVFKRFNDRAENCQNSRIYSLLRLIQTRSPLVQRAGSPPQLDYPAINARLAEARSRSLRFLFGSLQREKAPTPYTITQACTGCGVCVQVCSDQAISMIKNENGFYQSKIDAARCVQCGQCRIVCPGNRLGETEITPETDLFSFKAAEPVLQRSASGGAGYAIAQWGMIRGFSVYGCELTDGKAVHSLAGPDDRAGLSKFQGSKYLQSDFFSHLKELLADPTPKVVFGTPCQIAGLHRLLERRHLRDRFLLVDLVCHGVPSDLLWKKYRAGWEKRLKTPCFELCFRDKRFRWRERVLTVSSGKRTFSQSEKKDLFYRFFTTGSCYSHACYQCRYRASSAADIRIGDYWGSRFRHDSTGVSMVMPFTPAGRSAVTALSCTRQPVADYFAAQQTKNAPPPIYWEALLEGLRGPLPLPVLQRRFLRKVLRKRALAPWYMKFKLFLKSALSSVLSGE